MRALFDQVLAMSLAGSWAVAFVLLARLLLYKAPARFRYLLWGLVLLRLLCPLSLESSASLLPARAPVSATAPAAPAAPTVPVAFDAQPDALDAHAPPDGSGTADTPAAPDAAPAPADPAPAGSAAPRASLRQTLLDILRTVWLPGAALLLAGGLLPCFRLRRRLVGAARLRDNIWLADHIDTAFVFGVVRPRIYLPSSLPPEEQPYILLHEQTHLRRFDPLWKLLGFAALCVHWFNPLVWLAVRCAERDMELSCDEAVLARLGADIRQPYAASLLRLAAKRQPGIAFGEGSTKARIRNVLRYRSPKLLVSLAGAAVVILLACGLLTDPVRTASLSELTGSYRLADVVAREAEPTSADPSPEALGHIILASDGLYMEPDQPDGRERTSFLGRLEETALTDFDALVAGTTLTDAERQRLKRENRCAWRTETGIALLMLQRDGSLYLLSGVRSLPGSGDETGPRIRYVLRLEHEERPAALLPGEYAAVQILYDAPVYSFTYTAGAMPSFTLQDDGRVTASGHIGAPDLGERTEIALTPDNFDALFHSIPAENADLIRETREQTERAWLLRPDGGKEFHYLLLLNGKGSERTLLLASGYQTDGAPSSIRWLFLLARGPERAQAAAFPAGEYTAAKTVFHDGGEPAALSHYALSRFGEGNHQTLALYEQPDNNRYAVRRGSLYPIDLNAENFDALFGAGGPAAFFPGGDYRQKNAGAWQLTREQEFYQVLLQTDGQLYLVRGVSDNGRPLLAQQVDRLTLRSDGETAQKLPYRQAYEQLLAFRTEGFEARTAADFNRTLAQDGDLLERYAFVSENLPANDPNADFFRITLNASCGEIYAEAFHEINFFAISFLDHRDPIDPAETAELLTAEELSQLPLYQFQFHAMASVEYEIDSDVTVGARDNLLRALDSGLRDYVAAQTEDFLLQNDMKQLLAEQAQAILAATPHDGIRMTIEIPEAEAFQNRWIGA